MLKRFLSVSLLINLLLTTAVGFLLRGYPSTHETPVICAPAEPTPTQIRETTSEAHPQPPATPFRWSQLEATDYFTYVANLRAIDCPEETIRDIISADVANLFNMTRSEAKATMPPETFLQHSLQLKRNEAELIVSLFGPPSPPRRVIGPTEVSNYAQTRPESDFSPEASLPPGSVQEIPSEKTKPVLVPLAFLPPHPDANLTAEQESVLDELSKEFIQAIGGADQNPNDPEYLKRWQKAQPEIDAQLHAMFGDNFYGQQLNQATSEM